MLKVPLFLCEQNAVPGKVTTAFEKHAARVYGTFIGARDYLQWPEKYVHAGNPIRRKVLVKTGRDEARRAFHLTNSRKVILAIGGSQGALKINELIYGLKAQYPREFNDVGVIWSTGSQSYERFKSLIQSDGEGGAMYLSPFIDRVGLAYAASDIAISRSGSGVMMELAAMGIPSIQIPYPFAAMNHQDKNADDFVQAGAAIKIANNDASPGKVGPVLIDLLNNERMLKKMKDAALAAARPDAGAVIADDIIAMVSAARQGKE
jgi:UDP-N-acetylglucosamine--N-acetylmuramyl-(pentapeptide) pyrophosphoryl-undecaprenol N-acetylglucosamine transferase